MFDEPLGGHGHIRTLIGNWAEELTIHALGGRRHRTDCRYDYCPDISSNGCFIECKAAGRTNQTFIYAGRLEKDWRFSRECPLMYCIWHHGAKTTAHEYVSQLFADFLASLRSIFIVPFWALYTICRRRPCEKLNSKYGSSDSNSDYGAGYRVNLSMLRDWEIRL
ncbi:MAG: hypothetical protein ACO1RT_13270 [Planctomycetaceae bacterium]